MSVLRRDVILPPPTGPKLDVTIIGQKPPRGGVDGRILEETIKRMKDEEMKARLERAVDGALSWLSQSNSNPDKDRLQDVTVTEARGIILNALESEGFPV